MWSTKGKPRANKKLFNIKGLKFEGAGHSAPVGQYAPINNNYEPRAMDHELILLLAGISLL
jgi:hypothetical protein